MSKQCHFCKNTFWEGINGGFIKMNMTHIDGAGYRIAEMDYCICGKCYTAVRETLINIRKDRENERAKFTKELKNTDFLPEEIQNA